MKVLIDKERPVVTAQPAPRTMTDIEDAAFDASPHSAHRTLSMARKKLELHADGTYLPGVACAGCNATADRGKDTPALRRRPGSYPGTMTMFTCVVCQRAHAPSELNRMLLPKAKRPRVRVEPTRWYAVRCKGGAVRLGDDFIKTAAKAATRDFNPDEDLEAVVVIAYEQAHAAAALQRPDLEIPWKVIPTTGQCEPLAKWHGLPLTISERSALSRVQRAERRRAAAAIETKVANFRAELQAERSA